MSRGARLPYRALLPSLLCHVSLVAAASPLQIPFNTTNTMGPDGPWNFITLSIGSNPASNVSFYPMIEDPYTFLVAQLNCANETSLCQANAEYYNAKASSASTNTQQLKQTITNVTDLYGDIPNVAGLTGTGYYWLETLNAPFNFSNISSYIANNLSASIAHRPYVPISYLSLEKTDYLHHLNLTSGAAANSSTPPEQASNAGRSNSFGMHVGAAAFGQPGSLYLGGYDSSRVLAPMYQGTDLEIDTITFGTASGNSPPWVQKPGNFVTEANPGIGGLRTLPHAPYIYLAREWCNAMAACLPVDYDAGTNLFLWKTADPAYSAIVNSPSYINFTFKSTTPFSIRVPFATLNLTLGPPLKQTSTPYFPCYGRQDVMALGRAFLQSVTWGKAYTPAGDTYYMAQAPGPSINASTPPNIVSLDPDNPILTVPQNAPTWEETWAGVLKPLGASDSSNGTESSTAAEQTSGLSGGAIAGVVIGVLAGVALLAAAVWFLVVRPRHHQRRLQHEQEEEQTRERRRQLQHFSSQDTFPHTAVGSAGATAVAEPAKVVSELHGTKRHEMDGASIPEVDGQSARYELSATSGPIELPAAPPA